MASSLSSKDLLQGVDDLGRNDSDQTVLEKHVSFFDRNHDGVVYPWETFEGLRAIGAGYFTSMTGAFLIHFALSGKTRPGKYPSPFFPIEVKNIHMAKHGSDSGVYDSDGRFAELKFEEIFRKFARTQGSALTSGELMAMLRSNREPGDFKGWVGSWMEWMTLYNLCKDERGLLRKEIVKGVYDGSLFERMERDRKPHKDRCWNWI
ncbi:probable peroxygenase 5 isoform X1 [Hibiscus syriacus]|uniref:probable peroxygenase 5 isoform X1 n=1 Tax=Hibiscus syriacus TaxID=106335 RepID=UPI0019209C3C|nr:probable peroxygenase 5 isoform X1 [Hibiscus syriacus]